MYRDTHSLMNTDPVKDYIPFSWLSMAQVKMEYYSALAHHYIAEALLDQPGKEMITHLNLLLLNTTCPVLANNEDPDQLASEEAN